LILRSERNRDRQDAVGGALGRFARKTPLAELVGLPTTCQCHSTGDPSKAALSLWTAGSARECCTALQLLPLWRETAHAAAQSEKNQKRVEPCKKGLVVQGFSHLKTIPYQRCTTADRADRTLCRGIWTTTRVALLRSWRPRLLTPSSSFRWQLSTCAT
jgi:hypothetical protein